VERVCGKSGIEVSGKAGQLGLGNYPEIPVVGEGRTIPGSRRVQKELVGADFRQIFEILEQMQVAILVR